MPNEVNMGTTENYISIMIESLKRKLNILSDIMKENEAQNAVLKQDEFDMEKFQSTVDEKGLLIEKLNELDKGFDFLYGRVKEALDGGRDRYKDDIICMKKLITQITDSSVSIQRGEAENKILFEKQLANLKKDIQDARRSTSMANKYYKAMSKTDYEPQFMDKKK